MAKKCRFIRLERKQREELNAFIGVLLILGNIYVEAPFGPVS